MDRVPTPGQKGAFEGSSLYALKRKAKRLGQCRSCLRESCPSLVFHCGTTFKVYYCSHRKHSLRKGLQGMSKPTGWVETPCLIASVPSSGKGLSYPVNQTEDQSDEVLHLLRMEPAAVEEAGAAAVRRRTPRRCPPCRRSPRPSPAVPPMAMPANDDYHDAVNVVVEGKLATV
ncbi:hypothetical protein ACLOJK_040426 [Asimina triloba]